MASGVSGMPRTIPHTTPQPRARRGAAAMCGNFPFCSKSILGIHRFAGHEKFMP